MRRAKIGLHLLGLAVTTALMVSVGATFASQPLLATDEKEGATPVRDLQAARDDLQTALMNEVQKRAAAEQKAEKLEQQMVAYQREVQELLAKLEKAAQEQPKVLRIAAVEFKREPVTGPDGHPTGAYSVEEKTVLDMTVALPVLEFALLSGVEAWPEVRKVLGVEGSAEELPRQAQALFKLIDSISAERVAAFLDSLKQMKPGTELFTIQIENEAKIRCWVE